MATKKQAGTERPYTWYALELKQKGRRVWIRDNEKREYQEV